MSTMFTCPSCSAATRKLVAPNGAKKVGCPNCVEVIKRGPNYQLNQPVDSWRGPDGRKHTITNGKSWEIENRRISMDDQTTVINYKTGKETQR